MRRLLWSLAAGFAIVALAYAGLWFYLARQLEAALPAWAEAQRAQGYAVAWRSAAVGGFPFALTLRLDGASLQAARPFAYALAADRLSLATELWSWRDWRFDAPQGASLSVPLPGAGVAFASLTGKAAAGADALTIAAQAKGLSGSGLAEGFSASSAEMDLALPTHAPQADRDTLATASAALADAELPFAPAAVRHLDALSLALTMRGTMPSGPLEAALAAWRDAGGTLDIDALHLAHDGAAADVSGTLALDATLQPEGALTAALSGGDRIVDSLVASGALKARLAGFVKSVLAAISSAGEGGTLRVPVTIQEQRLYIGPAEVATLPHVTWR